MLHQKSWTKKLASRLDWCLLALGCVFFISCNTSPEPFPSYLMEMCEVNDIERSSMQQFANSAPSFRVLYIDGTSFCESQKKLSNTYLSLFLKNNKNAFKSKDLPHFVRNMPQANNFIKGRTCFILQHPRCVCHLEDTFSILVVGEDSENDLYVVSFSTIHETLKFVDEYFPQHVDKVKRLSRTWYCASD